MNNFQFSVDSTEIVEAKVFYFSGCVFLRDFVFSILGKGIMVVEQENFAD
jgi:hypothetical protein